MRDSAQDRLLDCVAAPERLGFDQLRLELRASLRRRSASSARSLAAWASVLVTTAATRKTPSAIQLPPSAMLNAPVGSIWKKLNAAAARTLVTSPGHSPQLLETSSTGSRKTTPVEIGGANSRSP